MQSHRPAREVTGREYLVPEGSPLVSTTDLKSYITYCNPAFIEVSGYTREELLGQPHNMIRHPDMPREAFRDMWATIQAGEPWSALVKNRRKNGDHYWVVANVTPVLENGRVAGYMSVRTRPTRAQVESAEMLYAGMRAEAEAGRVHTALRHGQLQRLTLAGRLNSALDWVLKTRFALVCAALPLLAVAIVAALPNAGGLALVLAMSLLAGWGLHGRAVAPLRSVIQAANRMAAGDLQQNLSASADDEIGQVNRGLNQLNVNLQAMVGDVRQQVDGISSASREISDGSLDLSARTETQASNLQQAAASLEQITGTIRGNAEAAQSANAMAAQASTVAEAGGRSVDAVAERMQEIKRASSRIGEIVQVIDGISFQTNLLALNAAVEAARAGEHGRGFAVVAGEVRMLAARTSAAAREIKQLVAESAEQVEGGRQLAEDTSRTVKQTVAAIRSVTELVARISDASREQATGISEVNTAVAELDGLTQQNAALVEQLSSSAASLNGQAAAVTEALQILRA
ncbi:methyl-accepting chemotaxis protein [Paucibacter sp. R3-3]|uniref:Methyl-accepting chemotaxis protein n=1 Tax=Roseateles agri TaxID=3098619 RepID=A0ABU5DM19_9BURK|nr:methyl-accepting chemotaxis protein [Paucibacter sp. R3-3]MDY0747352.1 methyl-accepting chemotaxis protein [Paucibacter sp. R3-3]